MLNTRNAAKFGVLAAISYIVGRLVLATVYTVASLIALAFFGAILLVSVFSMGSAGLL